MKRFVVGLVLGWLGKTIYDHWNYDYVDDDTEEV